MKKSSGILVYRQVNDILEYFLVRPGGPFYKKQDKGIWTIPKGIIQEGESKIAAARREFKEETGQVIEGELVYLGEIRLRKSKHLTVFTIERNFDETKLVSNFFELEYPKHSGVYKQFPEIEAGEWFTYEVVIEKIHPKLMMFLTKVRKKYI